MKWTNIYRVDGDYAEMTVIAPSIEAVAAWMKEEGHTGYPWNDYSLSYEDQHRYRTDDFCITLLKTIMVSDFEPDVEALTCYCE